MARKEKLYIIERWSEEAKEWQNTWWTSLPGSAIYAGGICQPPIPVLLAKARQDIKTARKENKGLRYRVTESKP